ncbi:MAG TPA: SWFGD domain-containing protein [Allosphingosinicella sp.]|nr:SWFGD domain-containing protein [Allosphingosinicella sp.]
MADDRYRDSGRGRGRGGSIFSDDEGGRGRTGESGGRGFFERARDEVRSWLGDEDGSRGSGGWSERSRYGQGQSGYGGEHYRAGWGGGGGSDRSGGWSQSSGSGSHFDENYRRWRDQQIARLDQEYEDYCRERQQRFESDFDSWRQTRQSRPAQGGETSGAVGSGRSAILGDEAAGATTTGGGEASAMESSTGSSPETGRGRG